MCVACRTYCLEGFPRSSKWRGDGRENLSVSLFPSYAPINVMPKGGDHGIGWGL